MDNPIELARWLEDLYIRYLDSALPLRDPVLGDERRALLRARGVLYQEPFVELVPRYKETSTLAEACQELGLTSDLADFAACGLFPAAPDGSPRRLYDHQYEALRAVLRNSQHLVVTTGTGSGKTECFLLPIFSRLLMESTSWGSSRPHAVRALILYPLNALAEDQMIRLRRAADSFRPGAPMGARQWLDRHRGGARFTFGRYTGATPVTGARLRNGEPVKQSAERLRVYRDNLERIWKNVHANEELRYHFSSPEPGSAELWDRWQMQENPPDILVTNHSMLNVMLMRGLEARIFDRTRDWLAEDPHRSNSQVPPERVFHLVVDELHTYRGTPGTEVAYLLRLLLKRLGLSPESPQLRLLVSSASLDDSQKSRQFLFEFFGVRPPSPSDREFSGQFAMVGGRPEIPRATRPRCLRGRGDAFAVFRATWPSAPKEALTRLAEALGDPEASVTGSPPPTLSGILARSGALGALFEDWPRRPEPVDHLTKRVLGDDATSDATAGLLQALVNARVGDRSDDPVAVPVRLHLFFRNLPGIWACSDPECSTAERPSTSGKTTLTVGQLYSAPRLVCDCGARVLDLLVCRSCGDVLLGGYRANGEHGQAYLVHGQQILEQIPSREAQRIPRHGAYAVYWPSKDVPLSESWEEDGERHGWVAFRLDPNTGEIRPGTGASSGRLYKIDGPKSKLRDALPATCPRCDTSYRRNSFTPIRPQTTGVQKVNQVLADGLMRQIHDARSRKLVVFTDSRQDAAKLAAGIELDHYRDSVRQSIVRGFTLLRRDIAVALSYLELGIKGLSEADRERWNEFRSRFPTWATAIVSCRHGEETEEERRIVDEIRSNASGPSPFAAVSTQIWNDLLAQGANPAGPGRSLRDRDTTSWKDLIDWENDPPRDKDAGRLTASQKAFRADLVSACETEAVFSLFGNRRRSAESMGLGWVTLGPNDRDSSPPSDLDPDSWGRLVDVTLRSLGDARRFVGLENRYLPRSLPGAVRKYVQAFTGNKTATNVLLGALTARLKDLKLLDEHFLMIPGRLWFKQVRVGDPEWVCPRCLTRHLHAGLGICIGCFQRLPEAPTPIQSKVGDDYYVFLASGPEKTFRLHCAELTGQTDRLDAISRQRRFQDLVLEQEVARVDALDLLSVTTTMEAGVDIGSLRAVMMGNVPPRRFNYQQRVGRAGRRGAGLSVALTVGRARSHDTSHFADPSRITGDPPSAPYLDMAREQILHRLLNKEILRQVFREITTETGTKDSIHGEFGLAANWAEARPRVVNWLRSNRSEVDRILQTLLAGTHLPTQRPSLLSWVLDPECGLVSRIDAVVHVQRSGAEAQLSERLAHAGLLPMFGMPTRTRVLYARKPDRLPATDVIDRDLQIAISQFAPGSQTVRDGEVLTSVGVVHYTSHRGMVQAGDGRGDVGRAAVCSDCGAMYAEGTTPIPEACAVCGATGESYRSFETWEPLGFLVEPEAAIDFDGNFEWTPRASVPRLSSAWSSQPNDVPGRNLQIYSASSEVTTLNDADGKLFRFEKLDRSAIWVAPEALAASWVGKTDPSSSCKVGLKSSKFTDFMSLRLRAVPKGLALSPTNERRLYARAAIHSWGYLIRQSACDYLDVEPAELEATIRPAVSPGEPAYELVLTDSLPNGAGYCRHLQTVVEAALLTPLLPGGVLWRRLMQERHSGPCSSSCYDCLNDYGNADYHAILDWRLGLDLAALADRATAPVDLDQEHWREVSSLAIRHLSRSLGNASVERIDGLNCLVLDSTVRTVVVHPLWSTDHPKIEKLVGTLGGAKDALPICTVFDILRRTGWCLAHIESHPGMRI